MNAKIFFFAIVIIFSISGYAQELNLDQILDKYYKAMALDKFQKINTVLMSGTTIQNDAMPLKVYKMRPDFFLMEFDVQDITAYQAYDGKTGWMTAPWTGNNAPQIMNEDRLKDVKNRADFDGLLYNFKQKGHSLYLNGTEKIENKEAYKIKIIRKDGGSEFLYIDKENFYIIKRLSYRNIRGQEITVETYYSEYKIIEGIPFAFSTTTYFGGQLYSSSQYDSIQLNAEIDTHIFQMKK